MLQRKRQAFNPFLQFVVRFHTIPDEIRSQHGATAGVTAGSLAHATPWCWCFSSSGHRGMICSFTNKTAASSVPVLSYIMHLYMGSKLQPHMQLKPAKPNKLQYEATAQTSSKSSLNLFLSHAYFAICICLA